MLTGEVLKWYYRWGLGCAHAILKAQADEKQPPS